MPCSRIAIVLANVWLGATAAGCGDAASPDPTRVQWRSPQTGSVLTGEVTLAVDVTAASSVRYDTEAGVIARSSVPPFTVVWNTRQTQNGFYTLGVTAEGARNNARDEIPVVLDNPGDVRLFPHPASASVMLGDSLLITVRVLGVGDSPPGLRWTVEGGEAFGTVRESGLYLAPAEPPRPPKATVTVRSTQAPDRAAAVPIVLVPRSDGR